MHCVQTSISENCLQLTKHEFQYKLLLVVKKQRSSIGLEKPGYQATKCPLRKHHNYYLLLETKELIFTLVFYLYHSQQAIHYICHWSLFCENYQYQLPVIYKAL